MLGTREYSVLELSTKLQRRFLSDVVSEVITELQNLGLLCNTRYGEAFCRSRVDRGYGPVFIQRELEQNGLDKELVETLLAPYNEQWLARAIVQVEKKARMPRPGGHLFLPELRSSEACSFSPDGGESSPLSAVSDGETHYRPSRDQQREAWHQAQKERARVARFLARRGFPAGLASRAINQVMQVTDH
ncbi:recombination regulator RecX [Gammaproteobacteria bacterium]|nr:recombination regulator RecX [Gammaproteobacteria bacterium]